MGCHCLDIRVVSGAWQSAVTHRPAELPQALLPEMTLDNSKAQAEPRHAASRYTREGRSSQAFWSSPRPHCCYVFEGGF